MLQGELSEFFISFLLDRFSIVVSLSLLFWLTIHLLYDRGYLGSWPPSNRLVRIFIWMFFLLPLTTGLVITGVLLLFSIFIPLVEPQLMFIVEYIDFVDYLGVIVFGSLLFFRVLRWCWKGYGTTGVVSTISVAFSASLAFSSLGLVHGIGSTVLEFGQMGWRMWSILGICWLRDMFKEKNAEEPEIFVLQGHSRIEVAMRSIYSVLIPLTRSIRVDQDESALRVLQRVLQMENGLERSLSLACKALGFDRQALIDTNNAESASMVLQNVATNWGNFSKLDLIALFTIVCTWIVSGFISIWSLAIGTQRENFIALVLFLLLPLGAVIILSQVAKQKPGREYDLAKRHDELFRYTQSEYSQRRRLDLLVLVIAMLGMTCVGIVIPIFGNPSLGSLILLSLLALWIVALTLMRYDIFLRGKHLSEENILAMIMEKLPKKIETDIGIPESDREKSDIF